MTALPQSTIESLERVSARRVLRRRRVLIDSRWQVLPRYRGQRQQQNNWCWAAVAASIHDYYRAPPQPPMRQCAVVNTQYPHDCCQHPASEACDREASLNKALIAVGKPHKVMNGTIGFPAVRRQIDLGRPVIARVEPEPGHFHFVVIYGYAAGLRLLVWDPEPGDDGGVRQSNMNDWREDFGAWRQTYVRS